jgi:hypothetical protein
MRTATSPPQRGGRDEQVRDVQTGDEQDADTRGEHRIQQPDDAEIDDHLNVPPHVGPDPAIRLGEPAKSVESLSGREG